MSDAWMTDAKSNRAIGQRLDGVVAKELNPGSGVVSRAQFLSDLSYDLRTPLAGIMGMLDLLSETPLSAEQRQYLAMTRECAEALRGTIEVSLSEAPTEVRPGAADLFLPQDLLDKVLHRSRKVAEGRRVAMTFTKDPLANGDLASQPVHGDFVLMEQLLDGAISRLLNDFPDGSLRITSSISRRETAQGSALLLQAASEGGRQWLVSMQATSKLIDATGQSVAFADFSMIERLVEALQGQLLVDQLGKNGLLVTLSIPLQDAEVSGVTGGAGTAMAYEPADGPEQTVYPPLASSSRAGGPFSGPMQSARYAFSSATPSAHAPTILLVEDNLIAQKYLSTLLSRRGFIVQVAESGEAALAMFFGQQNAATRFDLVLMDIQMPGMDGIETTRRIRQLLNSLHADGNQLPIVACTANPTEEIRKAAAQAGMTSFLAKPIRPAELVQTIEQLRCRRHAQPPGVEGGLPLSAATGYQAVG